MAERSCTNCVWLSEQHVGIYHACAWDGPIPKAEMTSCRPVNIEQPYTDCPCWKPMESTELTQSDRAAYCEAILNPPEPSESLKQAAEDYRSIRGEQRG